jgi:cellulose synthase/poly-beta-1,6-N-acetylglucosamine synthase-like glycosyltransferase
MEPTMEHLVNGDAARTAPSASGTHEPRVALSDASVVICAYTLDRWDDLNAAVASVRAQTYPTREIFVVIDEGNEALRRRAEQEIEGVTVVVNTKAARLSDARQTGAELATAPIIVFLDDDAIADPNWLAHLMEVFRDDRVLGAGGHIDPLWRKPRPFWFPSEFNWIVGCTYTGMPIQPNGQVRNLLGANMAVRADVIRQTGFATGWGGGSTRLGGRKGGGAVVAEACDETEFCIRASRLFPGGRWLYCPLARIQHVVPAQRTTWRYFVRRCRMEGTAKAVLTGLAGTKDGLDSERRYVLSLAGSSLREILAGNLGRALAIYAGLIITIAAYVQARLARAMA